MKGGPFVLFSEGQYFPPVILDYFPANGKPYACSGEMLLGIEALENNKDLVHKFLVETNAIVFDYHPAIGR